MGVAHTGPYQKWWNITYILSQGVGPPHPIQNSSWTSTHYWWPTWPILFQKGLPNYVFNCFHVFLIMSNVKRGIPKKGITNQTMLMYVFHVSFLWFHFQKAFISYMDEVFFVKQCLGNQGSASRISMAGGHLRISKTLRKDAVSLVAGMNSCEKAGFTRDPRNLQSGRTLGSRTPEKTWVYLVYTLSSLAVTTRKGTKKSTGQNAKYCGCLSWVPPKARKKKHEKKHEKERKNARKKAR